MAAESPPVLLYDGDCALCHRAVQFALRHDRHRTLRFAAIRSEPGQALLASAPPHIRTADSVIWVEPGPAPRFLIRSDAALALAHYLGGWWALLARPTRRIPRPWRDSAYDAIAQRRVQWFGPSHSCVLPLPHDRPRFLDLR